MKIVNMSNYMLAAYATPYDIISDATTKVLLEASSLFHDIITKKVNSPFASLSQMQFLHFMQYLMRETYSFEFFKSALEVAAVQIDDSGEPELARAYAMYFLNAAYIDTGATDNFDILLKKYSHVLPLDILWMIHEETKDSQTRSDLMKKHDRKIKHLLKDNLSLKHQLKRLFESPIELLPAETSQQSA